MPLEENLVMALGRSRSRGLSLWNPVLRAGTRTRGADADQEPRAPSLSIPAICPWQIESRYECPLLLWGRCTFE